MFIKIAKFKARQERAGIKVQQGNEGIRFQIEPDATMQWKWQQFYKTAKVRNITTKDIPKEILLKFLVPAKEKALFFNEEEQTPNFVL